MMSQTVWTRVEAPGFRGPVKVERECPQGSGSPLRSRLSLVPGSHRLHDRDASSCYRYSCDASVTRSL